MEGHARSMMVRGDSPVAGEDGGWKEGGRLSEIQIQLVNRAEEDDDGGDDSSTQVDSKEVPMSQRGARGGACCLAPDEEEGDRMNQNRGPPGGILARWKSCALPSAQWTARHSLYFCTVGCLLPSLICFGVNFGVGVAIFRGKPPPTMWAFPIPLAGDYAAVILVQTIINYPLFGTLSTLDIANGLVPPLLPSALSIIEMDTHTWLGWLLQPPELLFPPVDSKNKPVLARVGDTLKRVGVWFVLAFIPLWPLFTGVTYAIWGLDGYNSYPQPEFIAATLGAVLALVTCPAWTLVSLLDMGKRIQEESKSQFSDMIPPPIGR